MAEPTNPIQRKPPVPLGPHDIVIVCGDSVDYSRTHPAHVAVGVPQTLTFWAINSKVEILFKRPRLFREGELDAKGMVAIEPGQHRHLEIATDVEVGVYPYEVMCRPSGIKAAGNSDPDIIIYRKGGGS
jgi:hypothetical protein